MNKIALVLSLFAALASTNAPAQGLAQRAPEGFLPFVTIVRSLDSDEVPCAGKDVCPIDIKVYAKEVELDVDGKTVKVDVCIARSPTITFKDAGPGSPMRKIVWKLSADSSVNGEIAFHPRDGITLLKNPKRQIFVGSIGDDENDLTNPKLFHVHNKNAKAHDKRVPAVYVPFVLYYPNNGSKDNPSVCAGVDPKIVNG